MDIADVGLREGAGLRRARSFVEGKRSVGSNHRVRDLSALVSESVGKMASGDAGDENGPSGPFVIVVRYTCM